MSLAAYKQGVAARSLLVASGVTGRGLAIPSVDVVLNYDLPHDSKTLYLSGWENRSCR
jgi:superfamily II DNA/RNA helicase